MTATQHQAIDLLKQHIDSAAVTGEERQALQSAMKAVQKDASTLRFQLDRTLREKRTLSTLLARTAEDLEKSTELIKKMFGRYLSTEIMNTLLDNPSALELGGEKRVVTIMVTDLRGFTALADRLNPEQVVRMLNGYFEVMVDVILKHRGTINEIVGDSLLVIFGAPQAMDDRALRAIACAIDMQNAMAGVNASNGKEGLPHLEMGIGINDTEVVVGSIGSSKRSKYAVVGSGVNVTSRIESFSVGGQILISESVYRQAGDILRIDAQRDVLPKGMDDPIRIYEVGGIAGRYNLALERNDRRLRSLVRKISVYCMTLADETETVPDRRGEITRLSDNGAEIHLAQPVDEMTNVKIKLDHADQRIASSHFYGKVIECRERPDNACFIRFTSLPPEINAYLQAHLELAED